MHKPFLILSTALLLSGTHVLAAEPARRVVPTVTRTVQQFSTLENAWLDAVQQRDAAAIDKIVGDDFELRTAAAPGRPTARAQWLQQALATAPFQSSIEQMATHEYGELMIVSFLWKLDVAKKSALPRQVFVVDTWKQSDGSWKVVTRYAAPVDAGAKAVPGAEQGAPAIDKKI